MVTHPDSARAKRVRAVMDFIVQAAAAANVRFKGRPEQCCNFVPIANIATRTCRRRRRRAHLHYECTFCAACVERVLRNVCPNCGGGFVPRPIRPVTERRPGVSARPHPASTERRYLKWDRAELDAFIDRSPASRRTAMNPPEFVWLLSVLASRLRCPRPRARTTRCWRPPALRLGCAAACRTYLACRSASRC